MCEQPFLGGDTALKTCQSLCVWSLGAAGCEQNFGDNQALKNIPKQSGDI